MEHKGLRPLINPGFFDNLGPAAQGCGAFVLVRGCGDPSLRYPR